MSNYIYFDENDPVSVQKALEIARSRRELEPVFNSDKKTDSEHFPAFTSVQRSVVSL